MRLVSKVLTALLSLALFACEARISADANRRAAVVAGDEATGGATGGSEGEGGASSGEGSGPRPPEPPRFEIVGLTDASEPGVVSWSPVAGAAAYEIVVAQDQSCATRVRSITVTLPRVDLEALGAGGGFLCIFAVDADGELIAAAANNGWPLPEAPAAVVNRPPTLALAAHAGLGAVSGTGRADAPYAFTLAEGASGELTLAASDGDAATVSCQGAPAWATLTAGRLAFAPGYDAATAGVTFSCTASDGQAASSPVHLRAVVANTNRAPTLVYAAHQGLASWAGAGSSASPYTFRVTAGSTTGEVGFTAADPDGEAVTLSCSSLAWLTVDDAGKRVQVLPAAGAAAATHDFSCKARDAQLDSPAVHFRAEVVSLAGSVAFELAGNRSTGTSPEQLLASVVTTDAQGNVYFFTHASIENDGTCASAHLRKLDPSGAEITTGWCKRLVHGSRSVTVRAMMVTADGDLLAVGSVWVQDRGHDWWIKRFHPDGSPVGGAWDKVIDGGGGGNEEAFGVAQAADGSVYVAGTRTSAGEASDWWLKKFEDDGDEILTGWNKTWAFHPSESCLTDIPSDVAVAPGGDVVVSGMYSELLSGSCSSGGTSSTGRSTVRRYTSAGGDVGGSWPLSVGGSIAFDTQGNLFVADAQDVRKFSPTGAELGGGWPVQLPSYGPTIMRMNADGELYVGQRVSGGGAVKLYKLQPDGTETLSGWRKAPHGTTMAVLSSLAVAPGGDVIASITIVDITAPSLFRFAADGSPAAGAWPKTLRLDKLGSDKILAAAYETDGDLITLLQDQSDWRILRTKPDGTTADLPCDGVINGTRASAAETMIVDSEGRYLVIGKTATGMGGGDFRWLKIFEPDCAGATHMLLPRPTAEDVFLDSMLAARSDGGFYLLTLGFKFMTAAFGASIHRYDRDGVRVPSGWGHTFATSIPAFLVVGPDERVCAGMAAGDAGVFGSHGDGIACYDATGASLGANWHRLITVGGSSVVDLKAAAFGAGGSLYLSGIAAEAVAPGSGSDGFVKILAADGSDLAGGELLFDDATGDTGIAADGRGSVFVALRHEAPVSGNDIRVHRIALAPTPADAGVWASAPVRGTLDDIVGLRASPGGQRITLLSNHRNSDPAPPLSGEDARVISWRNP